MPVGATLAAATVTAGATVYSANQSSKAAKQAANAQQESTNQQIELQRDQYNQTRADNMPWRMAGETALRQLSYEMGLSPYNQMGGPQGQQNYGAINYGGVGSATLGDGGFSVGMTGNGQQSGPDYASYVRNNPDLMAVFNSDGRAQDMGLEGFGAHHWNNMGGMNEGRSYTPVQNMAATVQGPTSPTDGPPGTPSGGPVAPNGSLTPVDRYANFRNTPGYGFAQEESQRAGDAQMSRAGAFDSGAAIKAAQDRSFNLADTTYDKYFGRLQSLAGVGQSANAANQNAGQNYANNAGIASQNNANQRATSYGQQATANGQMAGALAGFAGQAISTFGRSPPTPPPVLSGFPKVYRT